MWTQRRICELNCPSGNKVLVRRPGPSMALKAGKIARILEGQPKAVKSLDEQIAWMESLDNAELEHLTDFARTLMTDIVVAPVVSLNPQPGEFHPDDIPVTDFWFIFISVMNGLHELPVPTKDGETTVAAVNNFPVEQAGSSEPIGDSEQVQ